MLSADDAGALTADAIDDRLTVAHDLVKVRFLPRAEDRIREACKRGDRQAAVLLVSDAPSIGTENWPGLDVVREVLREGLKAQGFTVFDGSASWGASVRLVVGW